MNRREFLWKSALTTAAFGLSLEAEAAMKSGLKFGYSAITWNGNDLVAIKEIAELGFKGIQLRGNTYPVFKDKPSDLKMTLDQNHLQLAMFSSGNVSINDDISKDIETHVNHAKFIKALGGSALQLTNNVRPKDRLPTTDELKKYANNLTEVGKRVADEGIQATYHNHMGQLGEKPEEVDIILQTMDTKYVKFLLDVAHYHQGGGTPAKAIHQYKDILHTLHIKDTNPTDENKGGYKFVELGQGKVDFPAIFAALKEIKFSGWGVVELDAVPVKGRTALESGKITKAYLESLKIKL